MVVVVDGSVVDAASFVTHGVVEVVELELEALMLFVDAAVAAITKDQLGCGRATAKSSTNDSTTVPRRGGSSVTAIDMMMMVMILHLTFA